MTELPDTSHAGESGIVGDGVFLFRLTTGIGSVVFFFFFLLLFRICLHPILFFFFLFSMIQVVHRFGVTYIGRYVGRASKLCGCFGLILPCFLFACSPSTFYIISHKPDR